MQFSLPKTMISRPAVTRFLVEFRVRLHLVLPCEVFDYGAFLQSLTLLPTSRLDEISEVVVIVNDFILGASSVTCISFGNG